MMRSLYSGVAGLKTHQTKMDVIGNNIANVNTVGFKSSSVNFSDTFYQTVSSASGADATTGRAGTNAKQIGLGSSVASITTNITENGGTSNTNRALDIAINGESFLIVNNGTENLFTKSGALNVDEAGNLYCTTNGCVVMGWMADTDGNIDRSTVKQLQVMTEDKMTAAPTATSDITLSGNIEPNDKNLTPTTEADGSISGGITQTFSFYDNLGELYTVKLRTTKDAPQTNASTVTYSTRVEDVLDANGNSIFVQKNTDQTTGKVTYTATGAQISFGTASGGVSAAGVNVDTGEFTLDPSLMTALSFNSATGAFANVGATRQNAEYNGKAVNFSVIQKDTTHVGSDSTFPQYDATKDSGGVEISFDSLTQYTKSGTSDTSYVKGRDGKGAGNYTGTMNGISIDDSGVVYANYTNGETKVLAQIAVASFSNPSGLEAAGDSLFRASLNSGEFDGVGQEVTSDGGSFTVGALEMSNVDLANEFTQMITTQRGFQANSRIITTSDTMLEELVNLKR